MSRRHHHRLLISSFILLLTSFPPSSYPQRRGQLFDRECNPIASQMKSKGFSYPWWNSSSSSSVIADSEDSSNHGCPSASSSNPSRADKCCKSFQVPTLMKDVQTGFTERWLGPKLEAQAKVFNESKALFDVTFKDLLTRAHASFDQMFEKTYGMLYIQHAHVFHELFATFRAYYDNGKGSLDEKLNNFFAILTRKMFEVLNSQYEFDDAYLGCAAIVISEKQGNELHRQIVSSLRRSFVATRALAQGLHDATAVLTSLQKLEATPDCLLSLSTMLHCPICLEARAYKPCNPLCSKVSSGCLNPTSTAMDKPWTDFLQAMEGVIDRLLGPYNVEAVVEPIHIKISEAIMNFQESGPDFSQAVFAKCGKPNLKSRKKRDAAAYDPSITPKTAESKARPGGGGGRGRGKSGKNSKDDDDVQPQKSLEKLLRETKKKVQKTKGLWEKLPQQFCNGISKDFSSQLCWNGSGLIKPDRNKSESENEGASSRPQGASRNGQGNGVTNGMVADQILVLQFITDKLRASYNGLDVQWVEEIEEFDVGSGQGSGSGDIPTDLDDSDDDDPNGEIRKKIASTATTTSTTNNNNKFSRPSGAPPPIFGRFPPNLHSEDDDAGSDNEHDNSVSIEENHIPGLGIPPPGGSPLDPSIRNRKPVNSNNNNPSIVIRPSVGTTSRPSGPGISSSGDGPTDVRRNPTSGGTMDVATKTVAVFKLFTPIFVSMLGKLVSLS